MRLQNSLLSLALLATTAAAADAQNCLGIASFSTGAIRADGNVGFGNDATTLGAGLSVGAPRGPFASVGISRISVDDSEGGDGNSTTGFGLQAGYELNLPQGSAAAARWSVCPVASFAQFKESEDVGGEDFEATIRSFTAGVSVGTSVATSSTIGVLPFGTLSFVRQSASFEGFGVDESVSESGGAIDLGVGLVFSQRLTVRPLVTIPLGFEGADPEFGVSVHFNFGSRR